jgi:hypothetical protein
VARLEPPGKAHNGDRHGQGLVFFLVLHSHQNLDEVALLGGRLLQRDSEPNGAVLGGVGLLRVVANLRNREVWVRKTCELDTVSVTKCIELDGVR